ncbi:MAG: hypothetical protein AAFN93_20990, partial [Bacteroidota bacterium]
MKKEDLESELSNSGLSLTESRPPDFPLISGGTFQAVKVDTIRTYTLSLDYVNSLSGIVSDNHEENYQRNLSANILDEEDVRVNNLRQHALFSVQMGYDYSTAQATPNSTSLSSPDGGNAGRLTLKELVVKGREGVQLTPSTEFTYYNSHNYQFNASDDWGYYAYAGIRSQSNPYKDFYPKNNVDNWSLRSIISPNGSETVIEYESDEYAREAIYGETRSTLTLSNLTIVNQPLVQCNIGGVSCCTSFSIDLPVNLQGYVTSIENVFNTNLQFTSPTGIPPGIYNFSYDPVGHRIIGEACCEGPGPDPISGCRP